MAAAPDPLTPRKSLLFRVLLLLLAASPFLLWEGYTRFFKEPVDLWALTGRRVGANPMASWALADAFSAYRARPGTAGDGKTVNSQGYISTPEIVMPKPAGRTRIVFLGGSSVAGTGRNLGDTETWPWRTVELLRKEMPGMEFDFINGALGGYTSFESFGRLWARIRFLDPDMVILCHGWNEMYYFDRADQMHQWRVLPDGSWSLDRAARATTIYAPLWIDQLLRPSQALSRVRIKLTRALGGEVGRTGDLAADFDHAGLAVWRTNLRQFKALARVLEVDLMVVRQATLIVENLSEGERRRCRYDYHGFDHDAHVAAFAALYDVIDEEIPADQILDLTPLSGKPELFYDHVHPTTAGTAAMARLVADGIRRRLAAAASSEVPGTAEAGEQVAGGREGRSARVTGDGRG